MNANRVAIETEIVRVRERLDAIHGQLADLDLVDEGAEVRAWLAEARGQQAVLSTLTRTLQGMGRVESGAADPGLMRLIGGSA